MYDFDIEQHMPARAEIDAQLLRAVDMLRKKTTWVKALLWSNLIFMLTAAGAIAYASYLWRLING